MRAAFLTVALFIAALTGVAAHSAPQSAPLVTCSNTAGTEQLGESYGYRVVLGIVSVPPAYLKQVGSTRTWVSSTGPWRYWHKAGLAIRAGRVPVSVTVPMAWRSRAAITWGDSGIVSSLRLAACPSPPNVWNSYAGGFYLRTRSACVPLVFRTGSRSTTVMFGLGRRCG